MLIIGELSAIFLTVATWEYIVKQTKDSYYGFILQH